jgi:cell division protein FtsW
MKIKDYLKTEFIHTWKYIVPFICFALWGWLAIYNSTFFSAHPFYSSSKQFVWLLISSAVLIFIAILPKQILKKIFLPTSLISLLLIWSVLYFGIEVNGMRGWFSFPRFNIQPSELGKPLFAVLLCQIMNLDRTTNQRDLLFFTTGACWLIPIFLQPDYGTLTVYSATMGFIYWGMGGSRKRILTLLFIFISTAIAIISSKRYVWIRIKTFLFPDGDPLNSGWHLKQYQNSLANGGLLGNAWGKSHFTEFTLPNPQHDSIFASLGETIGFVGLLIIIFLLALILYFCFVRAWKLNQKENSSIVYTLASMIAFQALLHISVTVGLFPTTGITFPFLSYGGSSLLSCMITFGIVINILKKENENLNSSKTEPTPTISGS